MSELHDRYEALVAKVVRTLDLGLPTHHSRGCDCVICQNREELIAMVMPSSGAGDDVDTDDGFLDPDEVYGDSGMYD